MTPHDQTTPNSDPVPCAGDDRLPAVFPRAPATEQNTATYALAAATAESIAPVVGLLGGIGAGKSTVARLFADLGAKVIDADVVGHKVLTRPRVAQAVVAVFGRGILAAPDRADAANAAGLANAAGSAGLAGAARGLLIDRRLLGKLVFADTAKLRQLEQMVHPPLEAELASQIAAARAAEVPLIVLDAAILLEADWAWQCDHLLWVETPRALRLARLEASRGWSEAELTRREVAQWPLPVKKARANAVVTNDDPGNENALAGQVKSLFTRWAKVPPPSERE